MVETRSTLQLELGAQAPTFELPDPDGRRWSLEEIEGSAVLVAFLCNHCPFVKHIRSGFSELAREYGVSRVTVRRALESLKGDRLIRREAGRGTFVIERAPPTESLRVEGSLDDLISMGVKTSVRLLELGEVQATSEQAICAFKAHSTRQRQVPIKPRV